MAFVRPRQGTAATAAASLSVDDFIVCIVVVVVIIEDGAIEDAKSGKGIHGVVGGRAHPNVVVADADANLLLRRGRSASTGG